MIIISEKKPIRVSGRIPGLEQFDILTGAAQMRNESPIDNALIGADGNKKVINELSGGCPKQNRMRTIAVYDNYDSVDKQLDGNPSDNAFSFSFADGPGDDEFVSEAIGGKRKKKGGPLAAFRARKNEKLAIRKMKVKGTADAKNLKAKAKVLAAKAQNTAAKNIGKEDPAVAAALAASNNASTEAPSSGMSPTTKKVLIGSGIGVVVIILGVVAYKIYKKKKGK